MIHGFLLAVAITLLVPFAVAAQEGERRYEACLSLAVQDPTAALGEARDWARAGGGAAARHCEAVAQLSLGNADSAASLLEGLLDEAPPDDRVRLLVQIGQAWLSAGETEKALRVQDEALRQAPLDTELLIDRSVTLITAGRYWEALDDLNRAHDRRPDRHDVLLLRARTQRLMERPGAALADVERGLTLAPDEPNLLIERGMIHAETGNREAARADWQKVAESHAGDLAGHIAGELLEELGEAQ